jgi:hypothetical protein
METVFIIIFGIIIGILLTIVINGFRPKKGDIRRNNDKDNNKKLK